MWILCFFIVVHHMHCITCGASPALHHLGRITCGASLTLHHIQCFTVWASSLISSTTIIFIHGKHGRSLKVSFYAKNGSLLGIVEIRISRFPSPLFESNSRNKKIAGRILVINLNCFLYWISCPPASWFHILPYIHWGRTTCWRALKINRPIYFR